MLKTTRLSVGKDDDMARYQWLDSDHGQPSKDHEIGVRDRRGEPRVLAGGTLLLLNSNVVLDVPSMRSYPVRAPLHDRSLWEYPVADQPAIALSPDKRQYVLVGGHETEGEERPALVVVDFQKDRGYAVPFDPKTVEAETIFAITPTWIREHFIWATQADGALALMPKRSVKRTR